MNDQIICSIDIGTSKIASVVAKLSETEDTPRILGFSSIESAGVKRGQIIDINQVTEKIEACLEKTERMAGQKINSCYVNIGGPQIESINSAGVVAVSQPDVEIVEADIDRAIEAAKAISLSQTREIIEVIPREYIVDGQGGIKNPLGMSGVRLEVNTHIITASHTNIKNIARCLSDLGINAKAFVFNGLACGLSTLTDTEKELGSVILDIGGGKIDGCVYVEGALAHSFCLPIGARHITNDIAVGLRISLDSAEKVKLLLSDKNKTEKLDFKKDDLNISSLHLPEGITTISYKSVVDEIIKPRVDEIFDQILKILEEYELYTLVPSGLIITGGGAATAGIINQAKRVVGLPARVGLPGQISGLIDEVIYPQYSSAIGMLIYGKEFESINQTKGMNFKDFDRIFRNMSIKGSVKKVADLFKSMIP